MGFSLKRDQCVLLVEIESINTARPSSYSNNSESYCHSTKYIYQWWTHGLSSLRITLLIESDLST